MSGESEAGYYREQLWSFQKKKKERDLQYSNIIFYITRKFCFPKTYQYFATKAFMYNNNNLYLFGI